MSWEIISISRLRPGLEMVRPHRMGLHAGADERHRAMPLSSSSLARGRREPR